MVITIIVNSKRNKVTPDSPEICHLAEATTSVEGLQSVTLLQVIVEGLNVGGVEVAEVAGQQVWGRVQFQMTLQLVRSVKALVAYLPDREVAEWFWLRKTLGEGSEAFLGSYLVKFVMIILSISP